MIIIICKYFILQLNLYKPHATELKIKSYVILTHGCI
uniref:Uncharacterized protein n=1 Tax=viral metagenome TaxID=1070528 RepID=A0A6C0D8Q0_9ZZZZ